MVLINHLTVQISAATYKISGLLLTPQTQTISSLGIGLKLTSLHRSHEHGRRHVLFTWSDHILCAICAHMILVAPRVNNNRERVSNIQ